MPRNQDNLIDRARAGDIEAFDELVSEHQSRLFRLVLAVTNDPDDAEDALQETLVQAYRSLPRFRGDASFGTWLYRIALNVTRNWLRSEARAASDRVGLRMARMAAQPVPNVEDQLVRQERRDLVRGAVLSLPRHYREAIMLRHYEEMSYKQIAEALEVPVGTVRSRIAQGRRLLMEKLESSGHLGPVMRGDRHEM